MQRRLAKAEQRTEAGHVSVCRGGRRSSGCAAIAVENLDFHDARHLGREHTGRRPARGAPGRRHRRLVSEIPTGRFRDRLTQMAANTGIAVLRDAYWAGHKTPIG